MSHMQPESRPAEEPADLDRKPFRVLNVLLPFAHTTARRRER